MRSVLLLILFLQQDRAAAVVERWRSENPADRDKATDEAIRRWKEWTEEELAAFDRAAKGADAEAAVRARDGVARIRLRRRLGEKNLALLPEVDQAFLKTEDDPAIAALGKAVGLWREGNLRDEDLGALAGVAAERPWGERAGRVLNAVRLPIVPAWPIIPPLLRHDSESVRALAAELVGSYRMQDYAEKLIEMLRDPSGVVRRSAGVSLRRLEAVDRAEAIATLLEDPDPTIRAQGVETLGLINARSYAERVAGMLEDSDGYVRCEALKTLGEIGTPPLVARLLPLLKDGEAWTRAHAVRALEKCGSRESADAIVPLLKDPEIDVRCSALRALGGLRAERHLGTVAGFLKDPEEKVRSAAGLSLRLAGSREHLPTLVAALKEKPECRALRMWAHMAIVQFRAREHYGLLADALGDEEQQPRGSAAMMLGRADAREFAPQIAAWIKKGGDDHRPYLIDALGCVGAVEQMDVLFHSLGDRGTGNWHSAAEALSVMVTDKQRDRIVALLLDPQPEVRGGAIMLLLSLDARECLDRIAPLTADPFPAGGLAREALGRWGGRDHLKRITPHLAGKEPHDRASAVSDLARALARFPRVPADAGLIAEVRRLEGTLPPAYRIDAITALLRLGEMGVAQQIGAIERLRPWDVFGKWDALELCDALLQIHEKGAHERLDRVVETRERIESGARLAELLAQAGLTLADPDKVEIYRRMPPGVKRSAREALRLSVDYNVVVADGRTLRMLPPEEALKHWLRKLSAM